MRWAELATAVWRNTKRTQRNFWLSVFGVAVGVAAFVFFVGLCLGIRDVLLGIFPETQVEVVAPKATVAFMDKTITDKTVDEVKAIDGVADVTPRMLLGFPAAASGRFGGNDMVLDLNGTLDGVSASALSNKKWQTVFRDWEEDAGTTPCSSSGTCADSGSYYCRYPKRVCQHRVPVIVSPALLALYNKQFARAYGMPVVSQNFGDMLIAKGGLRFSINLGQSVIVGSRGVVAEPSVEQAVIVGIDNAAMRLGATVPIEYVRRWREKYKGKESSRQYSSLVVTTKTAKDVAILSSYIETHMGLQLEDSYAQSVSTALYIVMLLFVVISFAILLIAAINIAHSLFMQVTKRKREIGILRAVGATRASVMQIILGEAAFIGVVGGVCGTIFAYGSGFVANWVAATWLPDFPFKPGSFFSFPSWLIVSGLSFAIAFCVLGGILPARAAARGEAASALVQ